MKVEEFLFLFFIAIPMEAICAMTEAETHTFSFCSFDSCYLLFPLQGLIYN